MAIIIDGKEVIHEAIRPMNEEECQDLSKQFVESYHRIYSNNHDR